MAVTRRRYAFLPLLVGILVVYALIVGLADLAIGGGARVLLLGLILVGAVRVRRQRGKGTAAALLLTALALGTAATAAAFGADKLLDAVLATAQVVIVGATIAAITRTLVDWGTVDTSTVLGVLCVYLLLALFFAELHQVGALWTDGYLRGVDGPPTASDFLYLSVVTLTTVGFGDITPATSFGRTVAITEALVGQLYLVSVVAGVVAGWRRPVPAPPAAPLPVVPSALPTGAGQTSSAPPRWAEQKRGETPSQG
jgi:hypothetical protein